MNEDKAWEVLAVIPSLFIIFVIHELIHIGLFHLFGQGKAKVIPKREKELGAVIMHQVNPEVFYTRNQMLFILLSPLILLTVLLLALHFYLPLPFLLLINIVLNSLGSSTDLYASYRLLSNYSRHDMINFEPDEHIMNIYERS